MHQRRRKLSIDDQKAVDVVLDHTASAGITGMTRIAAPVAQRRVNATTKLLSLLSEWSEADPPAGLAERTLQLIDSRYITHAAHQEHAMRANPGTRLH